MNENNLQPFFFSALRIEVRPSPETNSHEVRFLADGENLIARFWPKMMGMDPDDVLVEPSPLRATDEPRLATIARCSCGEVGCGSVEVQIQRVGETVEWKPSSDEADRVPVLRFDAATYERELERAIADTGWETPDRTAARLLRIAVDREALASHGLKYEWASGRIRKRALTISLELEPGPYQVLVHLPWDAETPHEMAERAARLLSQDPTGWPDVEWEPQQRDLDAPPPIAGPGWS